MLFFCRRRILSVLTAGVFFLLLSVGVAVPQVQAGALAAEEIWTVAEQALTERLATDDKNISYKWVRFTTLPAILTVPDGELNLTASLPTGVHYGTPTAVRVLVQNGEARVGEWQVTFQVKKFAPAVVTACDLPVGSTLSADNLRLEERDVTRLRAYYRSVEDAAGLELVRALPIGTLLGETLVRQPLLVKQGDIVRLIGRYGAVTVETTAEAVSSGRIGMLVRVKNAATGKVVTARVKARGMVETLSR